MQADTKLDKWINMDKRNPTRGGISLNGNQTWHLIYTNAQKTE